MNPVTTRPIVPGPVRPAGRFRTVDLFALGCGGLIALCVLVRSGGLLWFAMLPEGGVKLNNELSAREIAVVAELGLDAQRVVAYLDRSVYQDASDVVALTERQLVFRKDGRTTRVALADVEGMRHSYDPLVGDTIEIDVRDGATVKIDIAPMNAGSVLLRQLERVLGRSAERAQPPVAALSEE